MNREQRERFLKRIEAKYVTSQLIRDPWKGQKETVTPQVTAHNISESEIFQAIKNIRGVMMYPGSYQLEEVTGHAPAEPWGPTITFRYMAAPFADNNTLDKIGPNRALMSQVESALNTKFSQYIYGVGTSYDGENNDGKSFYTVTITQKTQR